MTKKCSKCKKAFPKTKEFFYQAFDRKDGFGSHCKKCRYLSQTAISQKRRDERRYEKLKNRTLARLEARKKYDPLTLRCAVLNCLGECEELHHVNYQEPLAVIPLCRDHHRLNHELCKIDDID